MKPWGIPISKRQVKAKKLSKRTEKGRSERDVAKARGRWTVVSSYVKVGE